MTKNNKMKTKLLKISKPSSSGGASLVTLSTEQQEMKGKFPLWQIINVENGAEHNMIKCDGAKWYWCDNGHSIDNKSCGMYCMHKPADVHIAWLARKAKFKRSMPQRRQLVHLSLLYLLLLLCRLLLQKLALKTL
jgi:hypothetical protein